MMVTEFSPWPPLTPLESSLSFEAVEAPPEALVCWSWEPHVPSVISSVGPSVTAVGLLLPVVFYILGTATDFLAE